MEWLSKDFREERQWKVALARKCVKAVSRFHQERSQTESKGSRSAETQARKVASLISREVLDVWGQVGRVVAYKHDQRLEKAKHEARDKHLDFLVGQTARYTALLTDGMTQPDGEEGEGEDDDDDDERPKVEKVDRAAELAELQAEADAPIDAKLLEIVNADEGEEDDDDDDDDDDEDDDEEEGGGEDGAEEIAADDSRWVQAPPASSTLSAGAEVPAPVETAVAEDMEEEAADAGGASAAASGVGNDKIDKTLAEARELKPTGATLESANVKVKVPHIIRGQLREYQHVALDWMVSMHEKVRDLPVSPPSHTPHLPSLAVLRWPSLTFADLR